MYKIPRKLTIKGSEWKIRLKKKIKDKGILCDGLTHKTKKLIEIDATLSPKHKKLTLIHELLHALIEETCVDISEDNEEVIVENITRFLYDTFQIRWK